MHTRLFNLIESSLYRTPLRLATEGLEEDPRAYHRAYDLGHTHASRGKGAEPDNPSVPPHLKKAYMAGFATGKAETASPGVERPEHGQADTGGQQGDKPSMTLNIDDVPESVGHVASTINAAGGRALLIGGSVRDKLMGKESKDWDIEVYGMDPDKLERTLGSVGKVDAVGKAFGVLKIVVGDEDFDVSIPRRESKEGKGHKGFIPVPDPTMSAEEATRRRDFTMNTLSMDPHTGEVYDYHGGADDIKHKILRATDPTAFADDPLRILRGAQFAARFGMTVEPNTMRLMQQASSELEDLPKERIGTEWGKLLLKGDKPSAGLDVMREAGVLSTLHPELEAAAQSGSWDRMRGAADRAVQLTQDVDPNSKAVIRYAAIFHAVPAEGMANMLRSKVDVRKDLAARIERLVGEQANVHDEMTDADVRRLSYRLSPKKADDPTSASIGSLARLLDSVRGDGSGERLLQRAKSLGVDQGPPEAILKGRDLMQKGVKGGPWINKTLTHVYDKQLEGSVTDMDSAQREAQIAMTQHECLGFSLLPSRENLNLL